MRYGLGPVFIYECITNARRWQLYAMRSFGVASLLLAMGAIATSQDAFFEGRSVEEYSQLGTSYFYALIGVELAVVMLAAPAATAGAICLDRSRGTLEHMLVTDLSDAEIVLGKLAARLMPVIALVTCSLPVLAISTFLGGIDLFATTLAFAVILAVAVFGCTLALALSVWARKPHEVILAVFMTWALLLLAFPIGGGIARSMGIYGPCDWLMLANPFYLACRPSVTPRAMDWSEYAMFFAATLGSSAVLAMLTIRTMRPSAVRGRGRVATIAGLGVLGRLLRWLPGPSLDRNPILWREWHRSRSPRVAALLGVLIGMTTVACGFEAFVVWNNGVDWSGASPSVAGGVYAYMLQVIIGLMVLSAVAPMSLSEERQRGSLDILMTTPLSTRTIVVGKWLSTFRLVPWLVIGPGLLAWAMATSPTSLARRGPKYAPGEFLWASTLVVITILAHGSAITSLGLILATWIRRQSRAIGISVTLFVLTAIAWPLLVGQISNRPGGPSRPPGAALSPFYTVEALVDQLTYPDDDFRDLLWEVTAYDLGMFVAAIGLMELTVRTFDRCLGRMAERSSKVSVAPVTDARARAPGDLGDLGQGGVP
jgi:ABC-type transport system involved in multi-copper enzyme maturation permease subunit